MKNPRIMKKRWSFLLILSTLTVFIAATTPTGIKSDDEVAVEQQVQPAPAPSVARRPRRVYVNPDTVSSFSILHHQLDEVTLPAPVDSKDSLPPLTSRKNKEESDENSVDSDDSLPPLTPRMPPFPVLTDQTTVTEIYRYWNFDYEYLLSLLISFRWGSYRALKSYPQSVHDKWRKDSPQDYETVRLISGYIDADIERQGSGICFSPI
jgi:hypothetical protein